MPLTPKYAVGLLLFEELKFSDKSCLLQFIALVSCHKYDLIILWSDVFLLYSVIIMFSLFSFFDSLQCLNAVGWETGSASGSTKACSGNPKFTIGRSDRNPE